MWILLAAVSAVSAGLVSVTVKIGMKEIDTSLGTFLRTIVVLTFTFIMVLIVGRLNQIRDLSKNDWIYIIASGICTGLSWFCYFKALQLGSVKNVMAIDKLSTVLTMILAIIILNEPFWWLTFVAMSIMICGTLLVIKKPDIKTVSETDNTLNNTNYKVSTKQALTSVQTTKGQTFSYITFAVFSLIFASLTSILAKIGMQSIDSNVGTFLRTIVVLIMAFIMVLAGGKLGKIKELNKKNWLFIAISGVLTGISWLCFYAALKTGIVSVVVPIDKLSILVAAVFSFVFLKEKLNKIAIIGLILLTAGTLLLLV